MKIAYFVPYVPSLIRIRPYKLIEHLVKLGVDVSLYAVGFNKSDLNDVNRFKLVCHDVFYKNQTLCRSLLNCAVALPTRKSFQAVYSWNPELAMEFRKQIDTAAIGKGYDLIHVEHLRGVQYAEYVRSNFANKPLVWDSVDCISHLFKQAANQSRGLFGRFASYLDLSRTKETERRQVCQSDHVLVTSPMDRDALLALVSSKRTPSPISVISNGVDLEYYSQRGPLEKEPNTIVFSGKMSYHANITMATYLIREIMPRVWQENPDTHVVIVGKDPGPGIRSFAQNPKVTVTGTVDDVRPFLWRSSVSVVPLIYGAGIQNKILESMAAGTPVVTTSRSLSALHVVAGRDLLVADSPEEFAMQILRLLTNRNLCEDIIRNGLAYVAKYHNWSVIARQLIEIYEQTIDIKKTRNNNTTL